MNIAQILGIVGPVLDLKKVLTNKPDVSKWTVSLTNSKLGKVVAASVNIDGLMLAIAISYTDGNGTSHTFQATVPATAPLGPTDTASIDSKPIPGKLVLSSREGIRWFSIYVNGVFEFVYTSPVDNSLLRLRFDIPL